MSYREALIKSDILHFAYACECPEGKVYINHMGEKLQLPDGTYRVPDIGPQLRFADYPEAGFYVTEGELGLKSILQGKDILFKETFVDPRAYTLVDEVVRHQFHHLDTRQLSIPERFETRDNGGRMDRLTTLVESAALIAKLGGTLEQIAQVMMSDINVTVDSHRIGDHLEGDYMTESTRDDDIVDYAYRSGLHDALVGRGVIDLNGKLAGSHVILYDLANPNKPRRNDIAECPRPDQNADRTPFTLIEGAYLVSHSDILDAVKSLIRVEVCNENGEGEERIASNSPEAARLLYELSVRHATEHWGNPNQKVILELITLADKYRFSSGNDEFHPIDYARTAEHRWYKENENDRFVARVYDIAQTLSREIKTKSMPIQRGNERFQGPPEVDGLVISFPRKPRKPGVTINMDTDLDAYGELVITLPQHKIRQPIDSLVAGKQGLQRISEMQPTLREYAQEQTRWLGAAVARLTLPRDILGELRPGIGRVNKVWHQRVQPAPLQRPVMPKDVLSDQIDRARTAVIQEAYRPTF